MDFKQELLQKQWEMQRKREMQRSQELQQVGRYVHQHTTTEQLGMLTEESSLTRTNLGNVRQIVSQNMPDAYDRIDDIRQADITQRDVRLHHSRGKRFVANGAKVLEFDMAGSGYQHFRVMHKGFHGKHIVNENGKKEEFKEQLKVSWYNKFFSWLPGIRSERQIQEENARRTANNAAIRRKYNIEEDPAQLETVHRELMNRQYGEIQTVNGREMKHIRKKVSEDEMKTRITMAGPLAIGGASNSGDYSIENLRNYMLTMGSDYLRNIFEGWSRPADEHDVNLVIRGHSRGGVASVEGAMMIKHWVKTNYPQYLHRVKFDLIQYDPVPGFGSYKEHASVNHLGQETIEKDGVKMEPLGENADTTVIYSMHTDHKHFFTPQIIKGAKRVILTPFTHGTDLGSADTTQEQAHRRGYTDAATGEVYRSSGINDLDEGVYIVDEQNTLIRMESFERAEAILKEFVKDTGSQQEERHQIMLNVAREWFNR